MGLLTLITSGLPVIRPETQLKPSCGAVDFSNDIEFAELNLGVNERPFLVPLVERMMEFREEVLKHFVAPRLQRGAADQFLKLFGPAEVDYGMGVEVLVAHSLQSFDRLGKPFGRAVAADSGRYILK
jgi:hypothetical protein